MAEGHEFEPRILGFLCNWCCYAGADLAGVSRFQYPPNMRTIRLMCSGRVDLAHIFRAFATGQDAVFIGGCHLNDCHYVTHGNYDALGMVHICKKLMEFIGLDPDRLKLEWVSAGEGIRFAHIMNEFVPAVKKLGPLGEGEGLDTQELNSGIQAVSKLIPYIKLVQAERLRPPERTEAAYHRFYAGEEFNRLFEELIGNKLIQTRIDMLFREKPSTAEEVCGSLGLSPSEAARHLKISARYRNTGSTVVENDGIDAAIEKYQGTSRSLVQVLLEIQSHYHWLPREAMDRVSRRLNVPLSRILHIVSFHKTFSLVPKGRHEVHVCTGPSCHVRGSAGLLDGVQEATGIQPGETDPASRFSLETGNCLGSCNLGPEIIVEGKHHGKVVSENVKDVLKNYD